MLKHLSIIILAIVLAMPIACKEPALTPKLFITVQDEILDSDMQPATKESIAAKYGITLEQYQQYENKVENDPELLAEVVKERLRIMKGQ